MSSSHTAWRFLGASAGGSLSAMALTGHASTHNPQPLHLSWSTFISQFEVTMALWYSNLRTAFIMPQQQPQQLQI